jgi:hypothetical protein
MDKFKEKWKDLNMEIFPLIGGDLALFLKEALLYQGQDSLSVWKSFVEALMSPLIQNRELPSWYKKVPMDWFINVTLHLPKLGPLKTSDPVLNDGKNASETSFHDHGAIVRFIRPNNTLLKYVANCPNFPSLEPTYVGNYQKLDEETFGRVDIVPAAFKVSSENSNGMEYYFISPSLNNLSVQYYIADNDPQEPLSDNHIETTLEDPSFNFIVQKPLHFSQPSLSSSDNMDPSVMEERRKNKHVFRSWIETPSINNSETIPRLHKELDEILYRVVASSAALGSVTNFAADHINSAPIESILQHFQGLLFDLADEFDVSVLFGPLTAIKSQYSNIYGLSPPQTTMEWELRGEALAEPFDCYLGNGKLLFYEASNDETPPTSPKLFGNYAPPVISPDLNSESSHIKEPLNLRQFADLMPLNISDGGTTDNTGIGRAVMERATHISCFAFDTESFIGLFENNGLGSSFPLNIYFDIFKCNKEEMEFLNKVLNGEDLSDMDPESINQNFKFVCRKTFRQSEGKSSLLKKLFICKFRDLSVKPNPYYFDPEATENSTISIVKEMSVVFAVPQTGFGISNGSLDADFTNYGTWVEEIHCALENGFDEDGELGEDFSASLKDKISSATILREFLF